MKRKLRSILLWTVCALLALQGLGYAEEIITATATAPEGVQEGTELTVGTVTPMSGHFGTELWGDNTSDMDVRLLLHGYAIVEQDKTPGLQAHTIAVRDLALEEQTDGSRVYTITIADGLAYNDGTPITAKDYVFSLLLSASPEVKAIGGTPEPMDHIRGYDAYQSGATRTLAGVRLLSDNQFSIQVEAGYSPYFYELTLLAVVPYPISVIAPGCEVADGGEGALLQKSDSATGLASDAYTPGEFSEDMLRVTLLDEETGYEYYPMVTSGPYQLVRFDEGSNVATFTVNPHFKGNFEGVQPHIENIVLRYVSNDTMFDQLEKGSVQLINKVASQPSLVKAQEIITNNVDIEGTPYLRSGLTFLPFACEEGPTASEAVRKAIAMALDRDALTAEMMGGMAIRVYGYYGLGQWMPVYTDPNLEDSEGTLLDSLSRLDIPVDPDGAVALLESDGWTLDAQGEPYVEGTRYREGADGLEPLVIQWAKPAENISADTVEKALRMALDSIGAELEATEMPFSEMLKHYYREEERTYNLFFLATNFGYVFDPYYDFHTDDVYQGSTNKTGLRDEELMEFAWQMRTTPPNDLDGYIAAWQAFQERFVEVLPLIPLYSGVYMDVRSASLKDYDILRTGSWALAIPYAWIEI